MRPFRGLAPVPETTSRMPTTKKMDMTTAIEAATTASGTARITATSLGTQASRISASPAAMPTLRVATPVVSIAATGVGCRVFGIAPARPARTFPTPSAATAPCTARKSTARGRRHDTRWVATATPTDLVAPTSAMNRKAGRSAQNAGPKPSSSPEGRPVGNPIQAASATSAIS